MNNVNFVNMSTVRVGRITWILQVAAETAQEASLGGASLQDLEDRRAEGVELLRTVSATGGEYSHTCG